MPYDFHFLPEITVGYPSSGGMWAFKFLADSGSWHRPGFDEWWPSLRQRPENWNAKMNYVLTMDERCEDLKDFGVIFYEKDCDDVATTLEEAAEKGRHYEMLLKTMDDFEYRQKLFDGL
jgi:hypothetical protein